MEEKLIEIPKDRDDIKEIVSFISFKYGKPQHNIEDLALAVLWLAAQKDNYLDFEVNKHGSRNNLLKLKSHLNKAKYHSGLLPNQSKASIGELLAAKFLPYYHEDSLDIDSAIDAIIDSIDVELELLSETRKYEALYYQCFSVWTFLCNKNNFKFIKNDLIELIAIITNQDQNTTKAHLRRLEIGITPPKTQLKLDFYRSTFFFARLEEHIQEKIVKHLYQKLGLKNAPKLFNEINIQDCINCDNFEKALSSTLIEFEGTFSEKMTSGMYLKEKD